MLDAEKLAQVGAACEQLERAKQAIEGLYDGEPVSQPPTSRAVELRKVARDLGELKRQVQELWS